MTMITETEELDEVPAACIRNSAGTLIETIEETVLSKDGGEFPEETVEEYPGETVEEAPGNAVEKENKIHRGRGKKLSHGFNSRGMFQVVSQKSHLKKMCEWLLPYVIAVILVICMGGAVMLFSYSGMQQLNRQLLEQYGEYFADE